MVVRAWALVGVVLVAGCGTPAAAQGFAFQQTANDPGDAGGEVLAAAAADGGATPEGSVAASSGSSSSSSSSTSSSSSSSSSASTASTSSTSSWSTSSSSSSATPATVTTVTCGSWHVDCATGAYTDDASTSGAVGQGGSISWTVDGLTVWCIQGSPLPPACAPGTPCQFQAFGFYGMPPDTCR